ncbi:hypothetical protein [Acidithiobacillus concretivorus]|uniref:Uncharacterized protein n=1 Tax=Acidithiobacillus concretivorus TaxID=3063952 RepID=A0ABS5ZTP4_9PROT|nr:hypothetical protein [Acidithiobacillus concretivorus]MBU2740050.1 hypothetical protein [Acidithiobacillus concretivorus]
MKFPKATDDANSPSDDSTTSGGSETADPATSESGPRIVDRYGRPFEPTTPAGDAAGDAAGESGSALLGFGADALGAPLVGVQALTYSGGLGNGTRYSGQQLVQDIDDGNLKGAEQITSKLSENKDNEGNPGNES